MDQSPRPQEVKQGIERMDFPGAIQQVINGKKITRDEWKNPNIYGFLNGQFLTIRKVDGENYQWIINDGDLLAQDWFVVTPIEQEKNELG